MGDIPALSMLKDKIWKIKFLPRFEEQQDFREYIQYCGEMLSNAILVLGEVRGYMNKIEERIAELATYIRDASGTVQSDMNICLSEVKDIRKVVERSQPRLSSPEKSLLPNIEITDSVVGSYSRIKEQEANKQRTIETLDKEAHLVETLMDNLEAITSSNSNKSIQVSDITSVLVELETLLLDTNYIEYQTKAVEEAINQCDDDDGTREHLDLFDAANMINFSDLEIDKVNKARDERMTKISEETEDDFESEKDGKQKSARTPRSKSKSSHRKHSSKSNASKRKPEPELHEMDFEFARGDEVSDMDGVLSFRLNNSDQIVLDEAASFRAKQAIYFEEKKIKREQERRRLEREMRKKKERRGPVSRDVQEDDRDLEEMYRRLESEKKRIENDRNRTEELRNQRESEFKQIETEDRERKIAEERRRLEEEEMAKKQRLAQELEVQEEKETEERETRRKEAGKRREAEESRRREEQDNLRRQNSRNWDNFIYKRPTPRVNEETETYHIDICCFVSSVTTRLSKGDLECVASDDVDVINRCLDNADSLASSVVEIASNVGSINLEAPVRVYIPHINIPDGDHELLVKVSLDGGDWVYQKPLRPAKKAPQGVHLIGAGLDKFESAKLVVVTRQKAEFVMVTTDEVSLSSPINRYVKMDMQTNTFTAATHVRFEAHKVPESLITQCKALNETCKCIMACRNLVSVWCACPPTKPIHVRFLESIQETRKNVEAVFRLYKAEAEDWVIDNTGTSMDNDAVVVELPAKYRYYTVTEVVVLQSTLEEDIVNAVDVLHSCLHGNIVRLIVKQRRDNFSRAMIHCINDQLADSREKLLGDIGFNAGPPSSQMLCIREGQELCLSCNGNVAFASPLEETIRLPYYRHFDRANVQVELQVADPFLQKTLPEYIGHIQGYIQGPRVDRQPPAPCDGDRRAAMCIVLPKIRPAVKKKVDNPVIAIGLPNHVQAFARFVSLRLVEQTSDDKRLKVLAELDGKRKLKSMVRKARLKVGEEGDDVAVTMTIITDWMKTKPKYADKHSPILSALEKYKLHEIKHECKHFVKVYKGLLSDSALQTIADNLHEDNDTIGRRLGLTHNDLDLLLYNANGTRKFKAVTLMMKWRESDEAIQHGAEMFDKLLEILALDEETAHKLKATILSSAAASSA